MKREQRASSTYTDIKIPSRPGTYAIILGSKGKRSILIGRLGTLVLRQGYYAYVGSAFGPGGLKGRISRHLLGPRRLYWHVDYLGRVVKPHEVWYTCDPIIREHDWAAVMARWRAASIPLMGFGSSDCRCESHLFFFCDPPDIGQFRDNIRLTYSDHGSLSVHEVVKGRGFEGPPGPPVEIRLDPEEVENIVVPDGLKKIDTQEIGEYHYLMRFNKAESSC